MNIKQKSDNKKTAKKYRYFLESNFVGANGLYVFVYSNQDDNAERFKTRRYYFPKCILKVYNITINFIKTFCPSNWFWYKTILKLEN